MAKYTAHFTTTASAAVTADVPDDIAAEGAEAISEYISSTARLPSLCAQCSGWNQPFSLDLAEWEPEEHGQGDHKGLSYVTGPDGSEVLS